MTPIFTFTEIDDKDRIFLTYPRLKISDSSPAFYLILRGIIGNIQITQTFSNSTFVQSIDFINSIKLSKANYLEEKTKSELNDYELKNELSKLLEIVKSKCKSNLEVLPQYISDSFSLKDLDEVLSNMKLTNRNRNFFESLNDEFANFYYQTFRGCHAIAFIHLYRILEFVSYSFPVIYATSTKDFSKSFSTLKLLFGGNKDSQELIVFKKFIAAIVRDEKDYETLTIDIDIVSGLDEYNKRIYETIMKICDQSIFEPTRLAENKRLSIKFSDFSSFIITVRNRFFHLKNSEPNNIKSMDIVDVDFFFSLLNGKCAYFLSLITLVVIKRAYFQ